jgi:SAM-dependent methyltransferase
MLPAWLVNVLQPPPQTDWISGLKRRLKRHRRLATLVFYFVDLAYLDLSERRRFVASFAPGARLLNLGAGFRSTPAGFVSVDRDRFPGIQIQADVARLPFRDRSVDGILCEMVLEHVPEADAARAELGRVLRPGGRLFLVLPFLWPFHGSPGDYRRWTLPGIATDLADYETIRLGVSGGPTTTLVNVFHEWLSIALSFGSERLYRGLFLLLVPLLAPFKALDFLLVRYPRASQIAALLYFHGRRRDPSP